MIMNKIRLLGSVLIVFALSACADPIILPPQMIQSAPPQQICDWMKNSGRYEATTWAYIKQQYYSRNIDCSSAHRLCSNYGLVKGTPQYADCRMQQQRIASEEYLVKKQIKAEEQMHRREIRAQERMREEELEHQRKLIREIGNAVNPKEHDHKAR